MNPLTLKISVSLVVRFDLGAATGYVVGRRGAPAVSPTPSFTTTTNTLPANRVVEKAATKWRDEQITLRAPVVCHRFFFMMMERL